MDKDFTPIDSSLFDGQKLAGFIEEEDYSGFEKTAETTDYEKSLYSQEDQVQNDIKKYGLSEPTFVAVNLNESSSDKANVLKKAKEDALGMVKMASFDGRFQDPYPSPFLNLSDTQIPRTTTEIFKWCKYFYMFDPLVSGAINALATFPITEVYLEEKNKDEDGEDSDTMKTYKKVMFKTLNIHKLLIEIGIDYYLYGNCFVFGEMWKNPTTGEPEWKHMIRLDPSRMVVDYNPATQEKKYKWQVPAKIAEIVKKKLPVDEYDKIPDIIKEAVRKNQAIVLNSNNVYHFARATDSMGDNSVWGTPVIANVLKLLMYRNILRQAQEAIAREHIVPMRVYYINKTDTYDPNIDFNAVAANFAGEINKAIRDPNHKVVSPVPINMLSVGGEGRSLMLTPEIEQVQGEILAGMNIPREFIFGGVSYSGSSISLKILENQFITYRLLLKDFLQNFVIKNMARARKEWINERDDDTLLTVKMQDLKMQDDVQQKQLVIQLNGAGKVTNDYMWKTIGIDAEKMKAALEKEALTSVEVESKVEIEKVKAQLEVQKANIVAQMELQLFQAQLQQKYASAYPQIFGGQPPMDPSANMVTQPGAENVQGEAAAEQDPNAQAQQQVETQQTEQGQQQIAPQPELQQEDDSEVERVALQLVKLPEQLRAKFLNTISTSMRQKVTQKIGQLDHAKKLEEKAQVDMRPMPDQKPPRRDSLK
jgi:hypothetical protein